MRRRRFVGLTSGAVLASACGSAVDRAIDLPPIEPPEPAPSTSAKAIGVSTKGPAQPLAPVFVHGVASGDPLADRVVLWTRLEATTDTELAWIVAEDPELVRVVARGQAPCVAARDHCCKVDVGGLAPATTYFYAFEHGGQRSAVGRTRTLPVGPTERMRLAMCSCANYPSGYFGVYQAMARRDDLDLVVHLGDYVYEYAEAEYDDGAPFGRLLEPATECFTLADYRARHGLYKRDAQLQALHSRHPMIAIWDDHEFANDTWQGGAKNHDEPEEGPWPPRRDAAVQAWREWMPVRDPEDASTPEDALRIWRAFRLGDLAELTMLDTRLVGRDQQLKARAQAEIDKPERSLLGDAQEKWLFERLKTAQHEGVAWKLIGQQVLLSTFRGRNGAPLELDKWDGYPAARERLLGTIARKKVKDVIVLTGDIHSSFAFEVRRDPFASPRPTPRLAVELVAPAVSSPPLTRMPSAEILLAANPQLRFAEITSRGYVTLELTHAEARATWHLASDITVPEIEVPAVKAFTIERGKSKLVDAAVG